LFHIRTVWYSVTAPDPGAGAWLNPGSGMGKKSRSGSGMNIPEHIIERIETIFWVKILKFFVADPGSGMEKFGSGIRNTGMVCNEIQFFCVNLQKCNFQMQNL
jgi:hypothetical protein